MTVGLGTTQKKLLYEMSRHDGTYPVEWKITPNQKQAFEALVRRGMVVPVTVPHPTLGLIHTYRQVERDLAGEGRDVALAELVQSLRAASIALYHAHQAIKEVAEKAERVLI